MKREKSLTILEAAAIIAGMGIGSGVMAIPFLFKNAGIAGGVIAVACAFAVSIVMHFMMADMLLNSRTNDIPTMLRQMLFRGKYEKVIGAVLFLLIVTMLVANLSSYVLGGAEVVSSLLGIPSAAAKLVFYVGAVLPVLFGIKAIGVLEKYFIFAIVGLVIYFSFVSFANPGGSIGLIGGLWAELAVFSMVMFSMTSLFAVPEVIKGLQGKVSSIQKAIVLGLGINLLVSGFICASVIASSIEVTEMAAVGWSKALGAVMQVLSAVFVLFAMMTSFWALTLSFSNIVHVQLRLNLKLCFFLATLPSLMIALLPIARFAQLAKVASGAISLLISIVLIPAYLNSTKLTATSPLIGNLRKSKLLVVCVMLGTLFMAIGTIC